MKLTKEMVDLVKRRNDICTIYDDKYVLLKKQMPVDDKHLDSYIRLMSEAKKRGINLATIVDYTLLENTNTHSGKKYTLGVYLEERATGVCISDESIWIRINQDYDYEAVANKYLHNALNYVEELEKRANASDAVYDKLVSDYLALENVGLEADPKPLNFFFDEKVGFTIIDPIPLARKGKLKDALVMEIWLVVFGYGLRPLMISFEDFHFLPEDLNTRLINCGNIICEKIKRALMKLGIDEEIIDKEREKNEHRYKVKNEPTEVEDLGIKIAGTIQDVAKSEQNRVGHSWFFD